jgi:hypothetical protein
MHRAAKWFDGDFCRAKHRASEGLTGNCFRSAGTSIAMLELFSKNQKGQAAHTDGDKGLKRPRSGCSGGFQSRARSAAPGFSHHHSASPLKQNGREEPFSAGKTHAARKADAASAHSFAEEHLLRLGFKRIRSFILIAGGHLDPLVTQQAFLFAIIGILLL